jgi:hypothetical protein
MELASKLRWIIVVVIAFVLMVLLGWGLASIARSVFRGNSSTASTVVAPEATESINAGSVRYIVDGPVVAKSEHKKTVIEVTPTVAMITVYSEYGQSILTQKSYANSTTAYDSFLRSLEQANATARFAGTTEQDDEAEVGVCSTGLRYILELGDSIRRWTTSCNRNEGTAAGRMTTIRGLFRSQIPDFNEIMNSLPPPAVRW